MTEQIKTVAGELNVYLGPILASIAIVLSAVAIHFLVFRLVKKVNKTNKYLIKSISDKLKTPGLIVLLSFAFELISVSLLPDDIRQLAAPYLKLLVITGITWLFVRLIGFGKHMILKKYDIDEKDNLKARSVYTQYSILEKILNFTVILIAIAAALLSFDGIRKIGISLFASAGVAGIILGFAAQKMIGTVLAGFQIALTQPIRLGDAVIVENEWGWIEEVTLTYVVIKVWDKRRLIVPTTYFIEKPFQNWTRVSSELMGTVFIYTDYTLPFNKLRDEITRILNNTALWDKKVNVLQVTNTSESSVELRALISAVDSPTLWDLRVLVREKIIEFIQNEYPGSLPRSRIQMEGKTNTYTGA